MGTPCASATLSISRGPGQLADPRTGCSGDPSQALDPRDEGRVRCLCWTRSNEEWKGPKGGHCGVSPSDVLVCEMPTVATGVGQGEALDTSPLCPGLWGLGLEAPAGIALWQGSCPREGLSPALPLSLEGGELGRTWPTAGTSGHTAARQGIHPSLTASLWQCLGACREAPPKIANLGQGGGRAGSAGVGAGPALGMACQGHSRAGSCLLQWAPSRHLLPTASPPLPGPSPEPGSRRAGLQLSVPRAAGAGRPVAQLCPRAGSQAGGGTGQVALPAG